MQSSQYFNISISFVTSIGSSSSAKAADHRSAEKDEQQRAPDAQPAVGQQPGEVRGNPGGGNRPESAVAAAGQPADRDLGSGVETTRHALPVQNKE